MNFYLHIFHFMLYNRHIICKRSEYLMKSYSSNPLVRYSTIAIAFLSLILFLGFSAIKVNASTANCKITGITETSATDESFEIIWDAINQPNLTYIIEVSKDNQNWSSATIDTSSYASLSKHSLEPAQTYYIRIRSKLDSSDTSEYSDYSEVYSVVTAPKAIANLRQTSATKDSTTIAWEPSKGATSYTIYEYVNDGEQKLIATTTNPTYTFKGLKSNTILSNNYYVTANNESSAFTAVSAKSDMISNLKTLPGKATGISVSYFDLKKDYSTYTWNRVASADEYEIVFYDLKNKKVTSVTTQNPSEITKKPTVQMKNKIKRNTYYKVKVNAYIILDGKKFYGKSSDSTYISSQPKITKIRCLRSGIKLTWNKVKGATNYTIYVAPKQYSNCKDYKKYKTVKSTSAIIRRCGKSRIKNKKTYYYYVMPSIKVGRTTYTRTANHYWKTKYVR